MNIKNFTYNDISFMSFGEAQSIKKEIDKLVEENVKLKEENERNRRLMVDDLK